MRKRASENRLFCFAGSHDFKDEVEIPHLPWLREPWMQLAPRVLQAERQRLIQWGAGLRAIVDQAEVNLSLR
jgi:hypothetical protein